MVAHGLQEIQLDAPGEAVNLASRRCSPDSLLALVREPLALAAGTTRAIHFCLGDIPCKPLIEVQNLGALILFIQQLDGVVDRVHVECFYSGQWDERALLAELPPSMEIIADVKSKPAPMTELCEKIEQLAQAISPQHLLISGSCGVSRVPHDDAIRLMRNLVKAALACRPPERWISAAPIVSADFVNSGCRGRHRRRRRLRRP